MAGSVPAPSAPEAARPAGWAVFDTALGFCGLAWGPNGLRCVLLPEADGAAGSLRARLARRFPALAESDAAAVPAPVAAAIAGIRALLAGEPRDLLDIALDDTGVPDFHRRVYALARRIPPGQTRSYGEVARDLGDPALARAVGQALGRNPFAPVVPCHRVLAARGGLGGFSAPGGGRTKLRLLAIEGATPPGGGGGLFDAD